VGVNTATISNTSGIGLAIPANKAVRIANKIILDEFETRRVLGILLLLDHQLADAMGVKKGLVVSGVIPGSVADAIGIQGSTRDANGMGDVILDVNDCIVTDAKDLASALDKSIKMTMTVESRDGSRRVLEYEFEV
jgi:S1-C subfamily serine protease